MKLALWIVVGLFLMAPSCVNAQSCQDPPPYPVALDPFRSHTYVPLPDSQLPATLPFIDVTIPPEVNNGLRTTTSTSGTHGFKLEGTFYTSGSGISDNFSHHAVFWHNDLTYNGYEYGFYNRLQNKRVLFYLCADCNTSSQRAAEIQVVDGYLNGVPMSYDVQVTSSGTFDIEIRRLDNGNLITSTTVPKPSWMANLHLASGHLTAVAHAKVNKAAFHDSYLAIEDLRIYTPQCIIEP